MEPPHHMAMPREAAPWDREQAEQRTSIVLRLYCPIHRNYRPEVYYFGVILGN